MPCVAPTDRTHAIDDIRLCAEFIAAVRPDMLTEGRGLQGAIQSAWCIQYERSAVVARRANKRPGVRLMFDSAALQLALQTKKVSAASFMNACYA